ncbi:MAG TPA: 2OG-Fe(II) oxygenase [Stellaceae bacterium]|nr:2OG-Fe(II) oxygenase [Stellaceae bacterium]
MGAGGTPAWAGIAPPRSGRAPDARDQCRRSSRSAADRNRETVASPERAVSLRQVEAMIFAVRFQPHQDLRGLPARHGVSRVRSGRRMTLGVIFHDAAWAIAPLPL